MKRTFPKARVLLPRQRFRVRKTVRLIQCRAVVLPSPSFSIYFHQYLVVHHYPLHSSPSLPNTSILFTFKTRFTLLAMRPFTHATSNRLANHHTNFGEGCSKFTRLHWTQSLGTLKCDLWLCYGYPQFTEIFNKWGNWYKAWLPWHSPEKISNCCVAGFSVAGIRNKTDFDISLCINLQASYFVEW